MNAVEITDEAVEAARMAYSVACRDEGVSTGPERFRAALEAALPHLAPKVNGDAIQASIYEAMGDEVTWAECAPGASAVLALLNGTKDADLPSEGERAS